MNVALRDASGSREPRVAFLLYDNRSGSTLASALLNRYAGVSVSHECDYVFQILEYPRPLRSREDVSALLEHLQRSTRFSVLELEPSSVLAAVDEEGDFSAAGIVRAVTRLYFRRRDPRASVWVVKGPRLHYHVGRLLEIYPDLALVQVVRDGRAVYASKVRTLGQGGAKMSDNVVHAAVLWRRKLRLSAPYAGRRVDLRFEDLVRDSEAALLPVLDGLGVPANARTLVKTQEEFARGIAADHQRVHQNLARAPSSERAEAWRQQLAPAEVLLFERVAGGWLRALGYPLAGAGQGGRRARVVASAVGLGARCTVALAAGVIAGPLLAQRGGVTVRQFLRRKWVQVAAAAARPRA